MPKYQSKQTVVEAVQWFKDYDHLQVDRYSHPARSGAGVCVACGKQLNEHGWLTYGGYAPGGEIVCPGDWIVTTVSVNGRRVDERRFAIAADTFSSDYEAVEQ